MKIFIIFLISVIVLATLGAIMYNIGANTKTIEKPEKPIKNLLIETGNKSVEKRCDKYKYSVYRLEGSRQFEVNCYIKGALVFHGEFLYTDFFYIDWKEE